MRRAWPLFASLMLALPAHAASLVCHYRYGGEAHTLQQTRLKNVREAYSIAPTAIGSYFLFRPVFEPGAVKLYTYMDHPDGPVLLHQASYPYPAATTSQGALGFTGEQRVYENIRDSELIYWCEIQNRP